MDISDKVSPQTKQVVGNLLIECQVLDNLLKERRTFLDKTLQDVLTANVQQPSLYSMRVFGDKWEVVLKEAALSLPKAAPIMKNRVHSRAEESRR